MKQSPSSGYRVEKIFTEELKQLNADQQSVVVQRLLNKHPLFKSVIGSQTDHAANEVIVHNLKTNIAKLRVLTSTWEMKQQASLLIASSLSEEILRTAEDLETNEPALFNSPVTLSSLQRSLGVDAKQGD